MLSGKALDRHCNDPLGLAVGIPLCLIFDFAHQGRRLGPRLVLDPLEELLARFFDRQPGNPLETLPLLVRQGIDLFETRVDEHFPLGQGALLPGNRLALAIQFLVPPRQGLIPLVETPLDPVDFLAAAAGFLLRFFTKPERFHLAFDHGRSTDLVGLGAGISGRPGGFLLRRGNQPGRVAPLGAQHGRVAKQCDEDASNRPGTHQDDFHEGHGCISERGDSRRRD